MFAIGHMLLYLSTVVTSHAISLASATISISEPELVTQRIFDMQRVDKENYSKL